MSFDAVHNYEDLNASLLGSKTIVVQFDGRQRKRVLGKVIGV